jgi:hypothetical protein
MTARPVARRLRRLVLRFSGVLLGATALGAVSPACYSSGGGSDPPARSFYFPVGLAVSPGGNALYVVNSDFDLQWNGGTLQSYDLSNIREHTAALVDANFVNAKPFGNAITASIPFLTAGSWMPGCMTSRAQTTINGMRVPLGEACAPPVDATKDVYFRDSAVIGAFATDLQLSAAATGTERRLFMPVRGDGSVTWASVSVKTDTPTGPLKHDAADPLFAFVCVQGGTQPQTGSRCDAIHHVGNYVDPADTRAITMPGEPFGLALSEDGSAMAVTHQLAGQSAGQASLLLTGFPAPPMTKLGDPSMQFVVNDVAVGGNGIVAVPHDPDAVDKCDNAQHPDVEGCVRPAFLQTSHSSAELDLLRYYDDDGTPSMPGSSQRRPFLVRERAYGIITNVPGFDSRGIVIDPTPRLLCKQALGPKACDQPGTTPSPACIACGQMPARVFIANRSPQSVIFGQIGLTPVGGTYDADTLLLQGNVPVGQGPSKLYLAPIVDPSGHYALRLFVVCYDAAQVWVFDPKEIALRGSKAQVEQVIDVGLGPFAMAFDPFCVGLSNGSPSSPPVLNPNCATQPFSDVVTSELDEMNGGNTALVPIDQRQRQASRQASTDPVLSRLRQYRFGYVASFTNSFLQVIDLEQSLQLSNGSTDVSRWYGIVFTLGQPTVPKGS